MGEALVDGIKGAMGELYADDPELGARLAAPALDIAQVGAQWWVGSAESEEAVRARIDDALCQLRFSPESSAVIVGHSHYFREMLRAFCADGCATPAFSSFFSQHSCIPPAFGSVAAAASYSAQPSAQKARSISRK